MRKFSIAHIGSNEWFNYKSEIIFGLLHSLRSLGHEVAIIHNQLDVGTTNIIVGADWLVDCRMLDEIVNNRIKYYVFEVEAYDGVTVNGRKDFNIKGYQVLLEHALGVITPYKYNVNSIRKSNIIPDEKIQYLKWGFFEESFDSNIIRSQSRRFVGTFFGLLKGERLEKAKFLQSQLGGRVAFLGRDLPHLYRAAVLSNSDYAISLSYGTKEKFVNPFRLYYLYSNGINVVADDVTDDDGYLNLATRVSIESMTEALTRPPVNEAILIENARVNDLKHNIKSVML